MIQREIQLPKIKSCFLFGPRQTGKTTLVKALLNPEIDLYINFLPQRNFLTYAKDPGRFRDEILFHSNKHSGFTCIMDEIQRIPELLNEVHDLIEEKSIRFIMTGSSARKLRRGGGNLLAGRAYSYQLFPLTVSELKEKFMLERALMYGCLPVLWDIETKEDPVEFLRTYTETYLREEIQAEGIVRNLGPFSQFLDIAAVNDGQVVNFSNIARECGVSIKTVQQYYKILEDTFIAYSVNPWIKSARKRLIAHPKYYFFDTGVTNALCGLLSGNLNPLNRDRRFEQFVFLQTFAKNEYHKLGFEFSFWRTNTGLEVDFLVVRQNKIIAAVEVKSSNKWNKKDLSGLLSFSSEHPDVPCFAVSIHERGRKLNNKIIAISWDMFLEEMEKL